MELNNPSEIVKDLYFGKEASDSIRAGVSKLCRAVKSTLGASGRCVIYEDALGNPVITKDGVTVADSVVLIHPVENIGATLIKEAARNTVKEAGDGTTTATVLADRILSSAMEALDKGENLRDIKNGLISGTEKIIKYINSIKKDVEGNVLYDVANISTNNDEKLGKMIADAYNGVGKSGVVLMEESETEETVFEMVRGVQFDCGLKSQHLATNSEKDKSELDAPYILISASPIPSIRKIQNILEFVLKSKSSLLIVAECEKQPMAGLMMNKVRGSLKVNIVDTPGFASTKIDTLEDLAALTGATLMDESLGDDFDMIDETILGRVTKAVTTTDSTILTIDDVPEKAKERIQIVEEKIKEEKNDFIKKKLEQRLAMLTGGVGIIKVGANSKIELKEKKDRVEDAIYAVKAAIKDGVVPGGGIALLNAASELDEDNIGESILIDAIKEPFKVIITNAGLDFLDMYETNNDLVIKGFGIDVKTATVVDMFEAGIIDPALVTITALKNAVSVASTIISADCIISNKRIENASA